MLFKTLTLVNLAKKAMRTLVPEHVIIELSDWNFHDTLVNVFFEGISFKFCCKSKSDLNVFLNPYYHEYDVPLFASKVLEKGDVIIDVGAYGGLYTLIGGKTVGETGQVIAFEANPQNFMILQQNVHLNKLDNVLMISKAAGKERSRMRLCYNERRGAFTSAHKRPEKIIEAEVIPIDDVTKNIDTIKLLKIDTEGCDLEVLKGAQETLKKTEFLIVEQNDKSVRKMLSSFGFKLYLFTCSLNLVGVREGNEALFLKQIFAQPEERECH
jgi:FkbM family methyltransferase